MGLGRGVVGGLLGGGVGAGLMVPLFAGAKRAGVLTEAPPVRVVDRAADAAETTAGEARIEQGEREGLAVGSHLLYGAAAGAVYGLVQDELALPAVAAGTAYGLVLWAAGYLGWMPAAGVLPRPWRQHPGDALVPVAAHVVYGLALAAVERVVREA